MKRLGVSTRLLSATLGLAATSAHASVVAIIDSGIDTNHKQLVSKVWINPQDSDYDGIDNDGNGFQDDIHGWNFIENNNQLIDYKYSGTYIPDIGSFFDRQGKTLLGTASDDDVSWMKAKIKEPEFLKRLMTYGNYAHGTHVTGIVAQIAPDAKPLGIKLIPTENPLAGLKRQVMRARLEGKDLNFIVKEIIKIGLSFVAKAQGMIFGEVGKYVGQANVDVANASLGAGSTQLKAMLGPLLKLANGNEDVPEATLNEIVTSMLVSMNREQESILRAAPNTLFVFAAGNEGLSNDEFPTAPASIEHPHVISVAATFKDGRLAPFSNFGKKVTVAAPGVVIDSTTPNDRHMTMSGTSQAAPYVAGIAALIKDTNPNLSAQEIKRILIATVDKLPDLAEKVLSGGVVNRSRAARAAQLSLEKPIPVAISMAISEVGPETTQSKTSHLTDGALVGPLFLPSPLGN